MFARNRSSDTVSYMFRRSFDHDVRLLWTFRVFSTGRLVGVNLNVCKFVIKFEILWNHTFRRACRFFSSNLWRFSRNRTTETLYCFFPRSLISFLPLLNPFEANATFFSPYTIKSTETYSPLISKT